MLANLKLAQQSSFYPYISIFFIAILLVSRSLTSIQNFIFIYFLVLYMREEREGCWITMIKKVVSLSKFDNKMVNLDFN